MATTDAATLFAPDAVAAVLAEPGFQDYLRRSIAVWPGEAADDAVLTAGLRNAGQYVGGMALLHLATTPGGLTPSRLAGLLRLVGLAPTRAAPTIALMRFLKLIEPVERATGDGRQRRYRPTERMAAAFVERLRRELTAAAPWDPLLARVLQRIDDRDFALNFIGRWTEIGLAVTGGHDISDDSLSAISTRTAGMVLLGRLLEAADREGEPFPPVGRAEFNMAAMVRLCGVSRTQIRRILQAGANAGHFVIHRDGEVELTPHLAEHVALFGMAKVLAYRWAARQMLEPAH